MNKSSVIFSWLNRDFIQSTARSIGFFFLREIFEATRVRYIFDISIGYIQGCSFFTLVGSSWQSWHYRQKCLRNQGTKDTTRRSIPSYRPYTLITKDSPVVCLFHLFTRKVGSILDVLALQHLRKGAFTFLAQYFVFCKNKYDISLGDNSVQNVRGGIHLHLKQDPCKLWGCLKCSGLVYVLSCNGVVTFYKQVYTLLEMKGPCSDW